VSSARSSGFGKGREPGRAASTPFIEKLRRDLGSSGKPERSLFSLRCEQGHALLWLLASPDGVVPVAAVWAAATATLGFCLRSHPDGAPFTLASWLTDEHLPIGSCPCVDSVIVGPDDALRWLAAGPRTLVHRERQQLYGEVCTDNLIAKA